MYVGSSPLNLTLSQEEHYPGRMDQGTSRGQAFISFLRRAPLTPVQGYEGEGEHQIKCTV